VFTSLHRRHPGLSVEPETYATDGCVHLTVVCCPHGGTAGLAILPPVVDDEGVTDPQRDAALQAELDARRRRRSTGDGRDPDWWFGLAFGGRIVAALMSLAVLVGSGYAWASYRSFVSQVTTVDAIAKPTAGPARHDLDGADQNILLVGDDDRTGITPAELAELNTTLDGGGVNTDTMMLLHVPADGSKATGISFPRDSWVDIPGFGKNKLNAAYNFGTGNGGGAAGGARLLISVIQNLTGLTIDHYVAVSMLGFYRIAETLGPIRVCLKQAAQDGYSGTNLPAGVSTLNASQALSFVRQRHNLPRGDLDREVRQQYFLSTEFRKIASAGTLLNPFRLQRLLTAVSSSIVKDPGMDLLKFAQQVQNLSAGNVTFATIPITGIPTITVGGNSVSIVAVDFAAIPGFIAKVIGRPTAYDKATAAARSTVTVDVINAAGVARLATSTATALKGLGFGTYPPDSADPATATTIEYPAGMESQAKALAQVIPAAQVALSSRVSKLTLVLGTDGVRVNAPASGAASGSSSASTSAAAPSSSPVAQAYAATDCIN
jgi:LCP family protein required for cell wall assembly